MPQSLKSVATGIVSGVVTCSVSLYTLAHTAALVMPRGFPLSLWEAAIVFGLGAAFVAVVIHFIAIWMLDAKNLPAFIGYVGAVVVFVTVTGLLMNARNAMASWLVGALLASLIHGIFRNKSKFGRPHLNE